MRPLPHGQKNTPTLAPQCLGRAARNTVMTKAKFVKHLEVIIAPLHKQHLTSKSTRAKWKRVIIMYKDQHLGAFTLNTASFKVQIELGFMVRCLPTYGKIIIVQHSR